MYKAIFEYQKISKTMKLKINLTLKPDVVTANKNFNTKIIDKFNMNGADYLKFAPYPFLVIDISSSKDRGDEWSSNNSVALSQHGIFVMKKALKKMLKNMTDEDLYKYIDDRLVMNKAIADEKNVKFIVSNKHILLSPSIVLDNHDEYEGITFMINSYANYSQLTLEEAEFLYDTLNRIDLMSIALQMMNASMLLKNTSARKLEVPKKAVPENETKEEDVSSNFSTETPESAIPDI